MSKNRNGHAYGRPILLHDFEGMRQEAQREASELLVKVLADLPTAHAAPAPPAPSPLWGDTVSSYLAWGASQGGKHGSGGWERVHADQIARRLRFWTQQLHPATLADITLLKVEGAVPRIPGASTKTKRDYLSSLSAFCRWCERHDLIDRNPLRNLSLPSKEPDKDYRALTAAEFQAILHVAPAPRRTFYLASALTGLRRKELLRVQVEALDVPGACLRLRKAGTKSRRNQSVPVPPALLAELAKLAKGRKGNEPLLKPLKITNHISRQFQVDREAAKVAYRTAEGYAVLTSLRDCRATLLQAQGATLTETQALMRHSDVRITAEHYTTVGNGRLHELSANLEASLCGTGTRDEGSKKRTGFQPKRTGMGGGRTGTRTPDLVGVIHAL